MPQEGEPVSKELDGGKGYWVKWHDTEFLALNFTSSKDREVLANLSSQGAGFGYKAGQIGGWLVIAYQKEIGPVPYDVYAQKAAEALSIVSGTRVEPQSITISGVKYTHIP